MVRIINPSKPPTEKKARKKSVPPKEAYRPLDERSKAILKVLGVALVAEPKSIGLLIKKHEGKLPVTNQPEALLEAVLGLLASKNQSLIYDLSELLSKYITEEPEDGYINLIIGAVGGIAKAVGSIAGNKKQEELAQEEARQNAIAGMMSYQAEQQKASEDQAKKQETNSWIVAAGVVGGIGLLAWAYWQHEKKKIPGI